MNIFGIGLPEMAVIAAIGLLVFGPKRLPELGKTLGRTLRGFQSASQEFEKEFRSAIAVESPASDAAQPSAADAVESPLPAAGTAGSTQALPAAEASASEAKAPSSGSAAVAAATEAGAAEAARGAGGPAA